jgi:hypothetical protein
MWFILEILIQNLQYTKNLPAVLAWKWRTTYTSPVMRGHPSRCPHKAGVPSAEGQFYVKQQNGSWKMPFWHPNWLNLVSPRRRDHCSWSGFCEQEMNFWLGDTLGIFAYCRQLTTWMLVNADVQLLIQFVHKTLSC